MRRRCSHRGPFSWGLIRSAGPAPVAVRALPGPERVTARTSETCRQTRNYRKFAGANLTHAELCVRVRLAASSLTSCPRLSEHGETGSEALD